MDWWIACAKPTPPPDSENFLAKIFVISGCTNDRRGFLSRVSILTRGIHIVNLSVRPSVCASVCYVPVSDDTGLTYRHSLFSPYGSPIILVLPASNVFTEFRRGHPLRGVYRWSLKISRFSSNKSLYLANDTRCRHSYYGRRIGTRMRSIKWCHFQ